MSKKLDFRYRPITSSFNINYAVEDCRTKQNQDHRQTEKRKKKLAEIDVEKEADEIFLKIGLE